MRLPFAKSLEPVVVGLPIGLPVELVGEGVVGELVEKGVGVLVVGADVGSKINRKKGFRCLDFELFPCLDGVR